MNRRSRSRLGLGPLALAALLAGCDYSAPDDSALYSPSAPTKVPIGARNEMVASTAASAAKVASTEERERREAILENVMQLIETAYQKPGGDNFAIATENLNQYFNQDLVPADFGMSAPARDYLLSLVPDDVIKQLESVNFTIRDARHIEDCMLYSGIATRVAGVGDDLTRVRRVFAWMNQQVQLIPNGTFSMPGLEQVPARPYDVLIRGMATEDQGYWAERGWLFMSLCRQLGIDVGLITYSPRTGGDPVAWICAALIDGKVYLFDARMGLEIPGPDGTGVATLEDALTDPEVLDRFDLPRQSPYGTSRGDLLGSPTRIGIMIDSSPGYLSPRMKLLQARLAGRNRAILYRDPAEQRDRFAQALGERLGRVTLWPLPITVITSLFTDGKFVASTQRSLALFDSALPLLYARMAQLRGELADAKEKFGTFRFAESPTLVDKKTPIPPEVQRALDIYATYYLALCHLDQDNASQAEFMLGETLRMVPEPGPSRPAFNMFRWGAHLNLARLLEARGETARAIQHYTAFETGFQPPYQAHAGLYRARQLVWDDPTAELPEPLPQAPPDPFASLAPAAALNRP